MAKPEDQRLLDNLHAGRSEAFADLVRGHYQAIYRFLFHLTHDIPRAEDLTQETFAAAWERISTFQGRSTLKTWLHRIAYTKFIDSQRLRAALRQSAGARHEHADHVGRSIRNGDGRRRGPAPA